MNLTYRGVRYASNPAGVQTPATPEQGVFRGVPLAWKRYQVASVPSIGESLQFLGRTYHR
ncbi:MAG: DUF4278 domain-containing protein [Leptolyngbyaceae cyanobacterium SM2_5_2]|nr:DUF4278 domain-containing protein [Leptolyngbyaceae cyanobacterium SM2_5_2]